MRLRHPHRADQRKGGEETRGPICTDIVSGGDRRGELLPGEAQKLADYYGVSMDDPLSGNPRGHLGRAPGRQGQGESMRQRPQAERAREIGDIGEEPPQVRDSCYEGPIPACVPRWDSVPCRAQEVGCDIPAGSWTASALVIESKRQLRGPDRRFICPSAMERCVKAEKAKELSCYH